MPFVMKHFCSEIRFNLIESAPSLLVLTALRTSNPRWLPMSLSFIELNALTGGQAGLGLDQQVNDRNLHELVNVVSLRLNLLKCFVSLILENNLKCL